ncbi:MAG TPA: cytochrome c oxidase subunit II [Kofleriaceae bacterium]|nr:cytochrome c oxidase subunit II [Kofleriaceae bacterium]
MNELFRHLLYLPPQASSVAHDIDLLHYTVIGSAFAVATLSFLAVLYILVRFREGPRRKPPRKMPTHALEIVLATVTLAAFLAWWGIGFSQYREVHAPPPGAIRIHVTAKQWMWQFVYPNGANAETDLRVPVGQPVVVLLTSRDVIHSFFVPAFRLKQDAIPGRITSLWFTATAPGTYDILCAEYCGAGHSRMRGRVIAMAPSDYARWVGSHVAPDLAESGGKLAAAYGCLRCHTIDGTAYIGPTWRGLYGSRVVLTTGEIVTADDAYLTESMMDPGVKLVVGFQPVMPSYLGMLSGAEAAAIVEYIRSLGATEAAP